MIEEKIYNELKDIKKFELVQTQLLRDILIEIRRSNA